MDLDNLIVCQVLFDLILIYELPGELYRSSRFQFSCLADTVPRNCPGSCSTDSKITGCFFYLEMLGEQSCVGPNLGLLHVQQGFSLLSSLPTL